LLAQLTVQAAPEDCHDIWMLVDIELASQPVLDTSQMNKPH